MWDGQPDRFAGGDQLLVRGQTAVRVASWAQAVASWAQAAGLSAEAEALSAQAEASLAQAEASLAQAEASLAQDQAADQDQGQALAQDQDQDQAATESWFRPGRYWSSWWEETCSLRNWSLMTNCSHSSFGSNYPSYWIRCR